MPINYNAGNISDELNVVNYRSPDSVAYFKANEAGVYSNGVNLLTANNSNPLFYGANPDGTTDSATAINNALSAATSTVFVPDGVYRSSTLGATSISKTLWGTGQIKTSDGNKRGKVFVNVTSAPTAGTHSSIDTAFNGTFKSPFAVEHRVTGSTTIGQPTSGYTYTPEASNFYGYLYTTTGYNHSTSTNVGRTGLPFMRLKIDQYGQGDAVAYNATVFVTGTKAGSTSFLANPAGVLFNGDMTAGADGVYLNSQEFALNDGGYDAAILGPVVNINRSNATGAKGAFAASFASQSTGSAAIDAHMYGTGKARIGLDFTGSDFGAGLAAIALAPTHRIYLNCANASSTKFPDETTFSNYWIDYDSSGGAIRIIHNNTAALQIKNTDITSPVFFNTADSYKVSGSAVVKARKTGWTTATGTATRTTFDTATVTTVQLAERVKALIDDLHITAGHGLIGA